MNTLDTLILHLSLIDGIGPATIHKVISSHNMGDNLSELYTLSASDIAFRYHLSIKNAQVMRDGLADTKALDQELSLIEKYNIKWITRYDPHYSTLLNTIHMPPTILYYQGYEIFNSPCIAFVGSREATSYGKNAIDQFISPLVAQGWVIVSGGARGADSMAHQATLNAGGKTIAVLGSGLLNPYPRQNIRLFEAIKAQGGAIVSSFHLREEPLPHNFPARNRIISGLSKGCVVVQANLQSGARITAEYSLEQGREVFAIPGPITDPLSEGCHALIQQGAKLTSNVVDILCEFGQIEEKSAETPKGEKSAENQQLTLKIPRSNLSAQEECIVALCAAPCSFDELLDATALPFAQLNTALFELQVKRVIEQNAAGLWHAS